MEVRRNIDTLGRSYATGRRKEAVARVWIKPGSGKFNVKKSGSGNSNIQKEDNLILYFKRESLCQKVKTPFIQTSTLNRYDVTATVKGGGLSGQADALAYGISKALSNISPDLHSVLRSNGFLTRDSRVVERKKYGQHKARKKCQYSKR
ncbi:30S ribosomal protein S9 [Wolbachia pipientis]|uniref:Small ribosomal subunit protein uS9 n=1 Tax=Wolbachia pipientis TaxID=955 RepID=A0A1E7QK52_WOLPI|nr:30S ribosomal protein S9 [Wolbachia pipientis]OEY86736.1 30S ribosomal protein S9 [Wolbachia pipientis]